MNRIHPFKKGEECYVDSTLSKIEKAYKTPSGEIRVSVSSGKHRVTFRQRYGYWQEVSHRSSKSLYTVEEYELLAAARELDTCIDQLKLFRKEALGAARTEQLRKLTTGICSLLETLASVEQVKADA